MNKKKRNVIDKAHELFIDKGYHGTSIQDILNHSAISKGSFYNYFTSKGELFKAVFSLIQENMNMERDELLIGEDIKNKEIFLEQISLMMELNRKNKLIQLVEEVLVSNEPELIKFVKQTRGLFTHWVYERFLNIFPENQAKYMADCAVLYTGMMQNILYTSNRLDGTITLQQIASYCLDRVITILEDVSRKDIQLFIPENLNQLLPESDDNDFLNNELAIATFNIKKVLEKSCDPKITTYLNLLHFIQKEIMNNKGESKKFLIESAVTTLKTIDEFNHTKEYLQYEKILANMDYYPIT